MKWNIADVAEAVARAVPHAPAQRQGDRTITWAETDRRADALGADLLDAGLGHQAKVAAYLQNRPPYLETYLAAFKTGLVPVNTNYRYGPEELVYLFDNADAEAVVFEAGYTETVEAIRGRLPGVRRWYAIGHDGIGVPDFAVDYEAVVGRSVDRPTPSWGRSGDDLLLLYTGGTTGMPKGVMWRQDDMFRVLGEGGSPILGYDKVASLDELEARARARGAGPVLTPACPLMHGTGLFAAVIAFGLGGSVSLLSPGRFDAAALWDLVERDRVAYLVIVGDAFAKPMLAELESGPARDLSSLQLITSSGVMWSQEVKAAMLEHLPDVALIDTYGSSEAIGMGTSVSTRGRAKKTASFKVGGKVAVITDDDRLVQPGDDEIGMVGISGSIPIGYYKDPEKSARTFRTVDGIRYSIPGDYARVEADGTLTLLGRGSVCINTGGEKVFPEEVEEVLKLDGRIADAVVVGVPDDRFGERVTAVVEPFAGVDLDADSVIDHVKQHLAHYKAPRQVLTVDTIGRAPNGKVDYKRLRAFATERAGS